MYLFILKKLTILIDSVVSTFFIIQRFARLHSWTSGISYKFSLLVKWLQNLIESNTIWDCNYVIIVPSKQIHHFFDKPLCKI